MKNVLKITCLVAFFQISAIVEAQVFDMIVAKDGSGNYTTITDALNAVTNSNTSRTIIFVKRGVYAEKIVMASTKINVSLIGENADSVIITCSDYVGKVLENGTTISGYQLATTFRALANDFYAENITFRNASGNVGQALAISTEADRQVFKNCKFLGFQDTYRCHKKRQYNLNCYIEGGNDFIYGPSQALFDNCTVKCLQGGSYITAPDEAYNSRVINGTTCYLGIFLNECTITAGTGVASNSFNLGRLWGSKNDASIYTNCTLGSHINKAGWALMTTDAEKTAFVGEYKSKNPDGSLFDISGRISWSKQISNELYTRCYNADSFFMAGGWNPRPITNALVKPANLVVSNDSLSWKAVKYARGYVIYRNGIAIGITKAYGFKDNVAGKLAQNTYNIESVNTNGNLSILSNADGLEDASSIIISPKDTMISRKRTLQFSAMVQPVNASQIVFWSVSDASVASITGSGLFVPQNLGKVTIKVSSQSDTAIKSTITIMVNDIVVSTPKSTIKKKETLQLTAAILPETMNQEIVWSVSNPSIAGISETGLLTAINAGNAWITARSKNYPNNRDSTYVTINPIVDSLRVYSLKDTVTVGKETLQLTASVFPTTFNQNVLWSSNDTTIATISNNGLLTPKAVGIVRITAISVADTTIKTSKKVHVIKLATLTKALETIDLEIFPNPARDFIYVNLSQNARITIFSLSGYKKIDIKVSSAKHLVDISTLEEGIYWVQIKGNSFSKTVKLIKQ